MQIECVSVMESLRKRRCCVMTAGTGRLRVALLLRSRELLWDYELSQAGRNEVLKALGVAASCAEIRFSWHDAAQASKWLLESFDSVFDLGMQGCWILRLE